MKKIFFTLLALVATMSMNAQVMKIMKGNSVVATFSAAQADNVLFEEESAAPIAGTAKRTGDIDVAWVQLWAGGPKFAEYNVGATSAADYGGYYAWGGSQDKVDDHNTGSETLSGNSDTATKLWGNNWRMPTQTELKALLDIDNCTIEWTISNGVNGIKFTGKGNYASNSVFIPAAGLGDQGFVGGLGNRGYIWASSISDTNLVYSLGFRSNNWFVDYNDRDLCLSVRAVLNE